jgi:hypothetical protein
MKTLWGRKVFRGLGLEGFGGACGANLRGEAVEVRARGAGLLRFAAFQKARSGREVIENKRGIARKVRDAGSGRG